MGQLQLKEIKGYLDSGLKIQEIQFKEIKQVIGYKNDTLFVLGQLNPYAYCDVWECKPILFPLSLFQDNNSDAMNDLGIDLFNQMELCDMANQYMHYQNCNYSTIEICLENKIDFQNLIGRGLAIPVTETFNPYK